MKIILIALSLAVPSVTDIVIDVNTTKYTKFQHFWTSTGFCPPDPKGDIPTFLLSNEQKINIAFIGSLPDYGIKHIRIHWLLNLLLISENEGFVYNFSYMDAFLSHLDRHGLMPVFEFMGFPNQHTYFDKTENFWFKLVATLVKRYIGIFGIKKVSLWRFETWNEPDLKGYNILNFTLPEYLAYVDGSSKGLKEAFDGTTGKWRLGGPAGLFRDKGHPLCWGLLGACDGRHPGTSGRIDCPLKFLSFHRKGAGTADGVLNGTFLLLDTIRDKFPNLMGMPIANDEADIEQNWSRSLEWRADCRYAAMITKVIAGYYKSVWLERKLKIEVLSNDNAFLNYHPFYFTQRTLFARFQINTTSPPHSQFIKKPAFSLMALLSRLGDERVEEQASEPDSLLTVLATSGNHGKRSFVSVILAYANETDVDRKATKTVNVVFENLPGCDARFVSYRLDNVNTNPYMVWESLGRPVFPSEEERRKMRDVEEPQRLMVPTDVNSSVLGVPLKLKIPSIHLIQICCKPDKRPGKVYSVDLFNITRNEVLITWRFNRHFSKCLRTYEVEIQSQCSSRRHFERINPTDTIFMSFHHVGKGDPACEWTRGKYRVRAVDYWDRLGKYSEIISYP